MPQQRINHPGGWRTYHGPFFERVNRLLDAWRCLTGHYSLHRAWQRGYDQHIRDESLRRARGGK